MAKSRFHSNRVVVLPAGAKGRGVFAKGDFVKDEVIESAPVIVLGRDEGKTLMRTELGRYGFDLGRQRVGVGLGYSSLYNHSRSNNAEFDSSPEVIRIIAVRNIRAGEEITINYRATDLELVQDGIPIDS